MQHARRWGQTQLTGQGGTGQPVVGGLQGQQPLGQAKIEDQQIGDQAATQPHPAGLRGPLSELRCPPGPGCILDPGLWTPNLRRKGGGLLRST